MRCECNKVATYLRRGVRPICPTCFWMEVPPRDEDGQPWTWSRIQNLEQKLATERWQRAQLVGIT